MVYQCSDTIITVPPLILWKFQLDAALVTKMLNILNTFHKLFGIINRDILYWCVNHVCWILLEYWNFSTALD